MAAPLTQMTCVKPNPSGPRGIAYGGIPLCHDELPSHLFPDNAQALIDGRTPKPDRVKSALLSLYPEGDVLSIVLHSVSGLWGYSLYSHGSVVRCAAGPSDEGVFANIGAPLPEELPLLQNSGGAMDEFGEDLTFEVTTRFFGRRLDDFEEIPLQMTQFRKPPATGRSFFGKRLGRG